MSSLKVFRSLVVFILSAPLTEARILRRQDPGFQSIPSFGKASGTFSNGAPALIGEPPVVADTPPDIYGARSIDIPFGRLFHGNMNFFSEGQLNTPTGRTDIWGGENDNANQSACGIPDNAFLSSKVAIHPYFLKYADLSRYCMQDVCISFWKEDGSSDMMLKVTDICSTDPNDPTHCASPTDIKIDRAKAAIMEGYNGDPTNSAVSGDQYDGQIWWFFMKCWDDGLAQPAYQGNNWFTDPPLANNINWAMAAVDQQWQNNLKSYPAKGWETYPIGAYVTERDSTTSPPIEDWVPGQEPGWSPVAGGVGWGRSTNPATTSMGPTPIQTSAPPSGQAPLYGQCGGSGWTGASNCVAGSTCQIQNPYYSQCL